MKFLFRFLLLVLTASIVNASDLYESTQPVSLTITAPFKKLFDTRATSKSVITDSLTEFINGTLSVQNPTTETIETYDVEIQMRGNQTMTACQFPKLKLKFKKDQTGKNRFINKKKYDLATHCINTVEGNLDFTQSKILSSSPHKEKFLFDIQEKLGFVVPKTQNTSITYIDNSTSPFTTLNNKPSFLIESQSDMIERLNGLFQVIGATDYSKSIIKNQITKEIDNNPPKKLFYNIKSNSEISVNEAISLHLFNLLIRNPDFYIKTDEDDTKDGYGTLGFHNVKCISVSELRWRIYPNDLNLSFLLIDSDQTAEEMTMFHTSIEPHINSKTVARALKIGTPEDFKNVINFYESKKSELYKMADSLSHDQIFMKNYLMYLDVFYKKLDSLNK